MQCFARPDYSNYCILLHPLLLQIAQDLREGGGIALVGAHPQLAEKLVSVALQQHLISELEPYVAVQQQKTFGGSRVDFVLLREDGHRVLLEVKNVVCADYPEGEVPEARAKVRLGDGRRGCN